MSDFANDMAKLLAQLEAGDITPEQFKALSARLIGTIDEEKTAEPDPVHLEEIETAAKKLREL